MLEWRKYQEILDLFPTKIDDILLFFLRTKSKVLEQDEAQCLIILPTYA